jgi:hypothetical protein
MRDTNELLEEIRSLVGENNDMLRAQRRNAFIGGIVKWIIRFAFILIPLYYYLTYVHPTPHQCSESNERPAAESRTSAINNTRIHFTSRRFF